MNNREIRFRESFRGYNRDDVKAYIEQLNLLFSKKESELKAAIAALEEKVNEFEAQPKNAHTDEEYDILASKLDEANCEIARLNEEKITESEKEKSRIYDEMSSQVGNILISANENADKILAEAREEAARIRSEAEIYASSVKAEANKTKEEIVSGITDKVKDFAVECVSRYGTIIGETNVKLESIADNLKTRSNSLINNLEYKTREIETRLTQLNDV